MQLKQACDAFLAHCDIEKNLSQHTLRAYQGDLKDFTTFIGGHSPITDPWSEHRGEEKAFRYLPLRSGRCW
jgi:site-specific recombinase XerD